MPAARTADSGLRNVPLWESPVFIWDSPSGVTRESIEQDLELLAQGMGPRRSLLGGMDQGGLGPRLVSDAQ